MNQEVDNLKSIMNEESYHQLNEKTNLIQYFENQISLVTSELNEQKLHHQTIERDKSLEI